ncbi:MAG: hypothetical protein ABIC95_00340 [archaeon]
MSYLPVRTGQAFYYINAETHDKFVDAIPESIKLDCIISEAFDGNVHVPSRFEQSSLGPRPFKQKCPVYVGDTNVTDSRWENEVRLINNRDQKKALLSLSSRLLEIIGGATSVVLPFKMFFSSNPDMTRRRFLKLGLSVGATGVFHILSDFFWNSGLVEQQGEATDSQMLGKQFEEWLYEKMPEYTLGARDAVNAQKAEHGIAQRHQRLGYVPHIGIYFGANHLLELKRMLTNKELRKKYLEIALTFSHVFHECGRDIPLVYIYPYDNKKQHYHYKGSFQVDLDAYAQHPENVKHVAKNWDRRKFLWPFSRS